MTLIAHISLAAAALIALCGMLRNDIAVLSQKGYSNKRFYSHLQESGDITSPARVAVLAVLMGSFTSMARDSWMVVLILAAVLAVTGIYLLCKKRSDTTPTGRRGMGIFSISLILAIVATGASATFNPSKSQVDSAHDASLMMQLLAIIAPLLVMLSNWLIGLITNKQKDQSR